MKYDFIIGNPPFETRKSEKKTQQIWATLVVKFFNLLKDDGIQSLIHPGGYRFINDKSMEDIQRVAKIYKDYIVLFMEFNNKKRGEKIFGVSTDYDIVIVQKTEAPNEYKVPISTANENIELDIQHEQFIPTNNISTFLKLKAKPKEEKMYILYSTSAYETRKSYMSKIKTEEFKYPCVYGHPKNEFTFFYSNTNQKQKDFFGTPKIIFKRGTVEHLLDLEGQ